MPDIFACELSECPEQSDHLGVLGEMQNSMSSFSLSFPEKEVKKRSAGYLLTAVLLFAGIGGCLWNIFELSETGVNPFLLFGTGFVFCAVGCGLPGKKWYIYAAAAAAVPVYVLAAGRWILEGWNITINRFFQIMEYGVGRIYPRFSVNTDMDQTVCATCFLVTATVLLALLCGRAAGSRRSLWRGAAIAAAAVIWGFALRFGLSLPVFAVIALIAAAAVLAGQGERGKVRTIGGENMFFWLLAAVAAMLLISLIPVIVFWSGDTASADSARRDAAGFINALRYDGYGEVLPEGDLCRLQTLQGREKREGEEAPEILTAVTDSEKEIYLRGFVGETYTGDGWSGLSPARRAEYATLFSWLHGRGFYGQNQYALLCSALGKDEKSASVGITNTGACTRYEYAPYEVAGNEKDEDRIGDENLIAEGPRGQSEYTYTAAGGSICDNDQLYIELTGARNRGDAEVMEYLASENAYREFVYENYLEVPQEARAAAERLLSSWQLPEELSFSDAKTVVDACLNTLTYREDSAAAYRKSDGDFLTYFLETAKEGDSFSFASAGTLIFRCLGVPARYVEGYRLTEEELQSAREDGTVGITAENACAWTEIYRDGVGFVPFEMSLFDMIPPSYDAQDQSDPLQEEPPDDRWPDSPLEYLFPVLFAILSASVLLLAVFLCLAVRRVVRMKKFRKLLSESDNAQAAGYAMTRLIRVLPRAGIVYRNGSLSDLAEQIREQFGAVLGEKYDTAVFIQQKALFSGKNIEEAEKDIVDSLLDEILCDLRKRSGLRKRFRMKWIDCLY